MIELILDQAASGFEQDIREITQAFYPEERFTVYSPEEAAAFSGQETPSDEVPRFTLRVDGSALALSGNRKTDKNQIKVALYRMFSDLCDRELPWGSLTGIRPVNLATPLLETYDRDVAAIILKRDYMISDEKLALMLEIAEEEKKLLDDIGRKTGVSYRDGWSLYLGIPFCPTRCLYCSFTSNPIDQWQEELTHYLTCMEEELSDAVKLMQGKKLQTVYIGGGTPTALPAPWLRQLMELVHRHCEVSSLAEFTVEAGRPDSITEEKLEILKSYGVTRISINPQSFQQKTLDLIGRKHTVEAVLETYAMARRCGFDNINMDIILGLPGEHLEEVEHTLAEIRKLRPESLTVHSLAVKRAARLTLEKDVWADVYRAGNDMETMQQMMQCAENTARDLGLAPYYLYRQKNMAGNLENVGYAAPGKACLYNILMMEEKHTVIGCGAGCSSKFIFPEQTRVERYENVKSIRDYLLRFEELRQKKKNFTEKLI